MATGLLVSVAAVSSAEPAYERQCHETPVRVSHSNGADADLVCAAATQAIDFMRRQGFRIAAMMPVRVLDEPLITFRDGELGRFDGGRLETSILSFEAARVVSRDDPPFGIAMNEHLYRSFVVHELAHAIAHPSFEVGRPSVEAQEYVAYSAQLATMHPPLRRAILHHSGSRPSPASRRSQSCTTPSIPPRSASRRTCISTHCWIRRPFTGAC